MPRFHAIPFAAAAILLAGSTAFADTTLIALLSNSAENPVTVPTLSTGEARPVSFGTATLVLNSAQTQITYSISVTNIDFTGSQTPDANDNLTAAHFHAGPAVSPSTNGGVVFGFFGAPFNDNNPNDVVVTPFPNGVGGTVLGKWDLAEGNSTTLTAQLSNLLNGHAYVNFHTRQFGGGEVRGNLIAGPGINNPTILPSATQGLSYLQALTTTGGTPPYAWAVQSGTLPAGLTLSAGGLITGNATTAGTSTFTAAVTDGASVTNIQTFTLAVLANGLTFTNALRLPHMVDSSTLITHYAIVNLEQTPVSYRFRFFDDTGAEFAVPLQNSNPGEASGVLNPGGIAFIQTAGTSAPFAQGWAEVASNGKIGVTAVFRFIVGSGNELLTSITGTQSGSNVFLPFDNALGAVTGVAVANTNASQSINVTMTMTLENGAKSTASITLPAHGHTSFALPTSYTATAGARGTIRFQSSGADLAVTGLRFGSNNGFVSLGNFQ
ncbi:MAG: CHRD domain-containing protein [Bryobacteraceae bacterium]